MDQRIEERGIDHGFCRAMPSTEFTSLTISNQPCTSLHSATWFSFRYCVYLLLPALKVNFFLPEEELEFCKVS